MSSAVGGIVGGACFQWTAGALGRRGPLYYLAIAQLATVGPWLLSTRLIEYARETPVRRLWQGA